MMSSDSPKKRLVGIAGSRFELCQRRFTRLLSPSNLFQAIWNLHRVIWNLFRAIWNLFQAIYTDSRTFAEPGLGDVVWVREI